MRLAALGRAWWMEVAPPGSDVEMERLLVLDALLHTPDGPVLPLQKQHLLEVTGGITGASEGAGGVVAMENADAQKLTEPLEPEGTTPSSPEARPPEQAMPSGAETFDAIRS